MTATPFDSPLYRDLFTDRETATLFTDTAELRAMLLTWGALALAQAKHGLIPETAAHAIQRAAMEIQIDPAVIQSVHNVRPQACQGPTSKLTVSAGPIAKFTR